MSVVACSCGPVVGTRFQNTAVGLASSLGIGGEMNATPGIGRDRVADRLQRGEVGAGRHLGDEQQGAVEAGSETGDEEVVRLLRGGVVREVALVGEAEAEAQHRDGEDEEGDGPAIAAVHGRCWITRLQRYATVSRRGFGSRRGTSRLSERRRARR